MTAAAAPDTRLVCAHCVVEMSGYGTGSPVVVYVHRNGADDSLVYGVLDEQVRAARACLDAGCQLSTSRDGLFTLYAVTMIDGTALCARHAYRLWSERHG